MGARTKGLTAAQRRSYNEAKLELKEKDKNNYQEDVNSILVSMRSGGSLNKKQKAALKKLRANADAVSKKKIDNKMAQFDEATLYDQLKNRTTAPKKVSKIAKAVRKKIG
tara:strand:+ start:1863 stop:2192 length:330 start_codon:yes stop_codon:yes gene_type:complete